MQIARPDTRQGTHRTAETAQAAETSHRLRRLCGSAICKIAPEPQASRGTRLPQAAGATGLFTYFQTQDLMTDADFVASFKVLAQVATGRSDHMSGVESGACSTRVGV